MCPPPYRCQLWAEHHFLLIITVTMSVLSAAEHCGVLGLTFLELVCLSACLSVSLLLPPTPASPSVSASLSLSLTLTYSSVFLPDVARPTLGVSSVKLQRAFPGFTFGPSLCSLSLVLG